MKQALAVAKLAPESQRALNLIMRAALHYQFKPFLPKYLKHTVKERETEIQRKRERESENEIQ